MIFTFSSKTNNHSTINDNYGGVGTVDLISI